MNATRKKALNTRVTMSIAIEPETYYRLHELRLARRTSCARLPSLRTLIDEALVRFVGRGVAQ